jgi:membrane fusion protein (multidrug efflux system)
MWSLITMTRLFESARPIARYALPLALTLFATACGGAQGGQDEAGTEAAVVDASDVAVVRTAEVSSGITISGSLQAVTEATIRAELAGRVLRAQAVEGQGVARGAVLAVLEDPTLGQQERSAQAAVASAQLSVQNARRDFERYQMLADAGAVTRREVENAQSTLAVAESQLSNSRSQQAGVQKSVGDATVRSPISGVVSAKSVNVGDVVQVGTELYRVVDPTSMQLVASVPTEQVPSLKIGDPVEFTVRGYPGRTFTGRIERIAPTADPNTRQIRVFVTVPNPGGALVSGVFAEGRVSTAARRGLMVPASAVRVEGSGSAVMRLHGGRAQQVVVQVGLRDESTSQVEIVSGLAAGDTVLVGPAMEIAEGTPLSIQSRQAAPVTTVER